MRIFRTIMGLLLVAYGINGMLRMEAVGDAEFTITLGMSMVLGGCLMALPDRVATLPRLVLGTALGVALLGLSYVVFKNYSAGAGWSGVLAWMIAMVALAGSMFAAIPRRLRTPHGTPVDLNTLTCPSCGSRAWQMLRMVHEEGTIQRERTVTQSVLGLFGMETVNFTVFDTEQTGAAIRANPPFQFEMGRQVAAMVLLGLLMAGMNLEKQNDLEFFSGMAVMFLAFFAWIVFGQLYNRTLRVPKEHRWEHQSMCSQCGCIFSTLDTPPPPSRA